MPYHVENDYLGGIGRFCRKFQVLESDMGVEKFMRARVDTFIF